MSSKLRKNRRRAVAAAAAAMLIGSVLAPVQAAASNGARASAGLAERTAAERPADSLAPPVTAASRQNAAEAYSIVAIGDSLTVGFEHGFTEQSVPYGYVERVYEQALFQGLRAEYANYGVLGLTSAGLRTWLEAAAAGDAVAAADIEGADKDPRAGTILAHTGQLAEKLKSADLIVVTIGGNDFIPLAQLIMEGGRSDVDALMDETLKQYEASVEASVRLLLEMNPKASVVLADQYVPVPKIGDYLDDYNKLSEEAAKLREALERIADKETSAGFRVALANVAKAFDGKALIYTSIGSGDMHPKQPGYEAMGKAFAQAVWGEYRTVRPRPAGVPLSIVVGGKELDTPNKPVVKNSRTYVAMRDIADATGSKLVWNSRTQSATLTLDGRSVVFAIGAATALVDGKAVPIDAPAYLQKVGKELKTYLPLAALSEALGFQVVFRPQGKIAFINK
ncbi:stalk domain-containing protein [Paenibacillus cisolokensis]|uniref:stalk domain-containing protein n=1 Tax=Paenibacillus cisolokensis TaxID=1658519 RepID=UPI003D2C7E99